MDSLTHLVLSLAGGYLLSYVPRMRLRWWVIPTLAVVSAVIDFDHLLVSFKVVHTMLLHNIVALALMSLAVGFALGRKAGLVFAVMLFGHFMMDMNMGLYGIPLFYPLSAETYMIPDSWEVMAFGNPDYTIVSKTGVSIALYFGAILAAAAAAGLRGRR